MRTTRKGWTERVEKRKIEINYKGTRGYTNGFRTVSEMRMERSNLGRTGLAA